MKEKLGMTMGVLAALLLAIPASASLIGDDVTPMVMINDTVVAVDPPTATVGDGPEFEFDIDPASVVLDIDAEELWFTIETPFTEPMMLNANVSIWLNNLQWREPNGDLSGGGIVGIVSIDGDGNEIILPEDIEVAFENEEIDAGRIGASIHIHLGPTVMIQPGTSMIHLRILTDHLQEPVIPEPATLGLFGIGLAGLAVRHRLGRKQV